MSSTSILDDTNGTHDGRLDAALDDLGDGNEEMQEVGDDLDDEVADDLDDEIAIEEMEDDQPPRTGPETPVQHHPVLEQFRSQWLSEIHGDQQDDQGLKREESPVSGIATSKRVRTTG